MDNSPLDRPLIGSQIAPRAPELRSRLTNHRDLLPGVNGRSAAARRFRDLVSSYIADMGGIDRCGEIKLGLLRRLAATTVQAELLEAKMVNDEEVDISTLCILASTSLRLASRLGLERQAREVGPSLGDMLRPRKGQYTRESAGSSMTDIPSSPIEFIESAARSRDRQAVRVVGGRARLHAACLHARCQRPFALPRAGLRRDQEDPARPRCAALIVLVMVLLRSDGRFAEGYCVANDLEQAQSRVFLVIRRIVEASPLLRHEAKITC